MLSVHGGDALPVKQLPESWGHFSLAPFMQGTVSLAGCVFHWRALCASVLDMAKLLTLSMCVSLPVHGKDCCESTESDYGRIFLLACRCELFFRFYCFIVG